MEEGKFFIREAEHSDLDRIVELWKELFNYHEQFDDIFEIAPGGEKHYRAFAEVHIERDDGLLLVVVEGDEVIGYCMGQMKVMPPIARQRDIGMIVDMTITASKRSEGLGRMLAQRVEGEFSKRGAERMELRAATGNRLSNHFWEKVCGYAEFGKMYFKDISQ